ncbi:LytTR family transcriptional regulator [Spirosoma sp. HMF4905]|uniref:LytTR family transcriptional regulator n=1 Tax=Spirosoma arboris TaxID=2682092 RepID=A0A7K1SFE9_9BACT|nr:LytTR family DNA-binding domain-containing protein [Spirosoma arboris]MVM32454.1 LytTR family transcriptional regulator [Spirosoma arboris]
MKRLEAANKQLKFESAQVLYLSGDINYCTLYLLNGKSILTSRTLKWYSALWPQFIRIHKANLVNPEHIYSCVVVSSIIAHLIMRNGSRLPIGRRRISEVVQQLGIDWPKKCGTSTHLLKPECSSFVSADVRLA